MTPQRFPSAAIEPLRKGRPTGGCGRCPSRRGSPRGLDRARAVRAWHPAAADLGRRPGMEEPAPARLTRLAPELERRLENILVLISEACVAHAVWANPCKSRSGGRPRTAAMSERGHSELRPTAWNLPTMLASPTSFRKWRNLFAGRYSGKMLHESPWGGGVPDWQISCIFPPPAPAPKSTTPLLLLCTFDRRLSPGCANS